MKYYILTGASRGIGEHIARSLANKDSTLFLLARSQMDTLQKELEAKGAQVQTVPADLSKPEGLSEIMEQIFASISEKETESIALINNAGMLAPMGPVGKHPANTYLANLQVNFTAAVLLCHIFIQKTQLWQVEKRIMNISSGAANRPYPGWAHYCSTKAGLNMFTSCIFEEQKAQTHPILAAAYNPGRTDTDMQTEIREQKPEDFPFVQSFIEAKKDGALNQPKDVAAHIVSILQSSDYPAGKIIPFR